MKLFVDTKWNAGLFDFDESTNELSKVLKCYKDDDSYYFYRQRYYFDQETYREANEEDIEINKERYFDDEGNQIFK